MTGPATVTTRALRSATADGVSACRNAALASVAIDNKIFIEMTEPLY
jgi:hypothetical protein